MPPPRSRPPHSIVVTACRLARTPALAAITARCKTPLPPPRVRGGGAAAASTEAPPAPALPATEAIPGVLAAGQAWKVMWSWEGNNADGPIAGEDGSLLFANNDASNVMKLDPATGLAAVPLRKDQHRRRPVAQQEWRAVHCRARSRRRHRAARAAAQMFANSFQGEPFECVGGSINDLMADARGGVYLAISGAGVFYANPQGVVSRHDGASNANGIILSPDEKTLYVTNGGVVVAFDVQPDGSLTNLREFAKLRGGQSGDGSAVDSEGRVYVATGSSADVFSPKGEFLGSIPGPRGMHGVAFGGKDKKTLFGIVFYGGWAHPARATRSSRFPCSRRATRAAPNSRGSRRQRLPFAEHNQVLPR